MIVCDTSTLSEFFRRKEHSDNEIALEIESLIRKKRLVLLGVVRQELLSGIKHPVQFTKLELSTRALPLHLAEDADHLEAAQYFNLCRSKGNQGSTIDFLICAMSVRRKFSVFSTDPDFDYYETFIPIDRHPIR